MAIPSVYPFHLHLYVVDPSSVEQRIAESLGLQVKARFGLRGSDSVRFEPNEGWAVFTTSGARFRLTNLARGVFDLVLGPGSSQAPWLEHFGVRVDDETYARCLRVFAQHGLAIREGERRSFFQTPFGIRLELVSPQHEGQTDFVQADYDRLHIQQVRFDARDPEACRSFFTQALGEACLEHLVFEAGDGPRPLQFASAALSFDAGRQSRSIGLVDFL